MGGGAGGWSSRSSSAIEQAGDQPGLPTEPQAQIGLEFSSTRFKLCIFDGIHAEVSPCSLGVTGC